MSGLAYVPGHPTRSTQAPRGRVTRRLRPGWRRSSVRRDALRPGTRRRLRRSVIEAAPAPPGSIFPRGGTAACRRREARGAGRSAAARGHARRSPGSHFPARGVARPGAPPPPLRWSDLLSHYYPALMVTAARPAGLLSAHFRRRNGSMGALLSGHYRTLADLLSRYFASVFKRSPSRRIRRGSISCNVLSAARR